MKNNKLVLVFVVALAANLISSCAACTEVVPSGYVGMVRTPDGFTGEILAPGNWWCVGRDHMVLLEVSDTQEKLSMKVLCADRINFSFDIGVLFSVDRTNTQAVKDAFMNIAPILAKDNASIITAEQLYEKYVKQVVDTQARQVISVYETPNIVKNRGIIMGSVSASITGAFPQTSLIKIKMVTLNNDDFPEFVTKAQELKAGRRVEIETERATQLKRIIIAQNELKIADLQYKIALVQAASIADQNRIIGGSVTPEYLAWWQLKVLGEAAKGPNNWGFIPYTDFVNPRTVGTATRTTAAGIIDAELIKRIQDARAAAQKTPNAPAPNEDGEEATTTTEQTPIEQPPTAQTPGEQLPVEQLLTPEQSQAPAP